MTICEDLQNGRSPIFVPINLDNDATAAYINSPFALWKPFNTVLRCQGVGGNICSSAFVHHLGRART